MHAFLSITAVTIHRSSRERERVCTPETSNGRLVPIKRLNGRAAVCHRTGTNRNGTPYSQLFFAPGATEGTELDEDDEDDDGWDDVVEELELGKVEMFAMMSLLLS